MSSFRQITHAIKPRLHGPNGLIGRLISPESEGEILKPFVFLDHLYGIVPPSFGFGFHPHSGIATLTYQVGNTDVDYTDTEGNNGILRGNGLEWMSAGGGAWHRGSFMDPKDPVSGFQLWIALPPEIEDGPPISQYVAPEDVPVHENVKVLLGSYGSASSVLNPHHSINYFEVRLKNGDTFEYEFQDNHDSSWVYVHEGIATVNNEKQTNRELLILKGTGNKLQVKADPNKDETRFLVASAVQHNHPLILGNSSVHTNKESLRKGLERIKEVGNKLKREGKI